MSEYWLHRVLSHEWDISYPLLKQEYISLGWSSVSCREIIEAKTVDEFNRICSEKEISQYRSRWSIWNIAHYEIGDIIVVPCYDGLFSVYKVVEKAKPICELDVSGITTDTGKALKLNDGYLVCEDTSTNEDWRSLDIGFVCKAQPIVEYVERAKYADAALTARMKVRQTTSAISSLSESVEKAITSARAGKPLNFYENVNTDLSKVLLSHIESDLTPDKVEELVKLYFQRMGASYAYIPAKNQSGKKDGADADVVAEFEPLKVIFYVQVKKHSGTTASWAVEQIRKYLEQMEDVGDTYTYIPWVITTADGFDDKAHNLVKEAAETKHIFIRLINGVEFAKMLLDSGIRNFDELADK